jgi:hypothetical protein
MRTPTRSTIDSAGYFWRSNNIAELRVVLADERGIVLSNPLARRAQAN